MTFDLNVILGNLHKMSLSKLLILVGFLLMIFQQSKQIGILMVVVGFIIYFRKF
jgi:hypothetical protein